MVLYIHYKYLVTNSWSVGMYHGLALLFFWSLFSHYHPHHPHLRSHDLPRDQVWFQILIWRGQKNKPPLQLSLMIGTCLGNLRPNRDCFLISFIAFLSGWLVSLEGFFPHHPLPLGGGRAHNSNRIRRHAMLYALSMQTRQQNFLYYHRIKRLIIQ